VLGLSYKPDTCVIEQSQGLLLAAALEKAGRRVVVHDPLALDAARAVFGQKVGFARSVAEAMAIADAAIVMVPWSEYKSYFGQWSGTGPTRLVVDCWSIVDPGFSADGVSILQLGRNTTFRSYRAALAASEAAD
jgi:UDPglucose 6-dehydrogenase